MPRDYDPHEDEALPPGDELDPEGPQECDLTGDEDETDTVSCPSCGREIAELAEQCPHCGEWVEAGAGEPKRAPWVLLTALVALAVFIVWFLL